MRKLILLPKKQLKKKKWISMLVSQSHGLSQGLKKWLFKIGKKDGKTHLQARYTFRLMPKIDLKRCMDDFHLNKLRRVTQKGGTSDYSLKYCS
ncbi:hypothetical protein AVEN_22362-1 [Araneus ventricosus]|uniref:Uncharacterized protein n=1 Tax=Araneus ventricosus TaxID=182803 RepID=A0A4Y2SAZ3_ARAVE|nr:hypothetical protein AVEN_22362-1 [Araneus ventricosus]